MYYYPLKYLQEYRWIFGYRRRGKLLSANFPRQITGR